jgi:hypothetical protein
MRSTSGERMGVVESQFFDLSNHAPKLRTLVRKDSNTVVIGRFTCLLAVKNCRF